MNPWRSELPLAFIAFLFTLFIGQLLHVPMLALWVGLLAYLCHHLLQLHRLLTWLESGKSGSLPGALGVWDDIYHLILKLRRSNKRRKKPLNDPRVSFSNHSKRRMLPMLNRLMLLASWKPQARQHKAVRLAQC